MAVTTTKTVAVDGNTAVAEALRQLNPDVMPAYPITPSTGIMQSFTSYVSNGKVDTETILVESEHSAMSACIGASAAGGRVATATSAQGMALMWEMLHIASGYRLPILMALVNRALSAPLNIHGDHSDGMGMRDCGWIQLFSENAQEAYDNTIMAYRIAEHKDVRLPIAINMDGFIISHSIESMNYITDEDVKSFVGEFQQINPLLDTDNPKSIGALVLPDYYMEHKRAQHESTLKVMKVVEDVSAEFGKRFAKRFGVAANTHSALGYDALRVLVDALQRARSTEGLAIRNALMATKDFQAVQGPPGTKVVFDEIGGAHFKIGLSVVKDGKRVLLPYE